MTEPLLDQKTLRNALRRLAERLHARDIVGDVYLFGGGAMVLAFDTRPATRDLDGRFAPDDPMQAEALKGRRGTEPAEHMAQPAGRVLFLPKRRSRPDAGLRPSEPARHAGI